MIMMPNNNSNGILCNTSRTALSSHGNDVAMTAGAVRRQTVVCRMTTDLTGHNRVLARAIIIPLRIKAAPPKISQGAVDHAKLAGE